jgi:hypothetical protein
MADSSRKWYLYHLEDGKIVMDRADHSTHHQQARKAMGLKPARYVGAFLKPMTKEEMERFEAHHKASFDHGKRKDLPEFEEPSHWDGIRSRNAAALAARGESK